MSNVHRLNQMAGIANGSIDALWTELQHRCEHVSELPSPDDFMWDGLYFCNHDDAGVMLKCENFYECPLFMRRLKQRK